MQKTTFYNNLTPILCLLYSFFPPPVGDGIDVKVTYSEHFEQ